MKVEIWLDYICPYSYMVKRRFETALDSFEHKNEVEIVIRSFELRPDAKLKEEKSQHEILAKEMGTSVKEAKAINLKLAYAAKKAGLDYNFETMIPANTHDAHRLTHYAASKNKSFLLCERIFKAYFTDSLLISDHETLASLAEEVGLDKSEALKVLDSTQYSDSVKEDIKKSEEIELDFVPFFLFDGKSHISGDQPVSALKDTIGKAYEASLH
ncbi:DsbA family oxidoreductase [Clostridium pasteurianum]|uniref:DsbA family oxidoreductase n=1 Tax=Clostridium pasteurianum TaxID=1501 RepID=UPI002260D31A|nr:DsbA family oxidoreductase [Clostridium pasteurianum]UZW13375.1 DsbA family oxidoreductase [Clostridium pasteurianum]